MAIPFNNTGKIVFENDMDIVSFVSGGVLCPSRRDFNMVMDTLHNHNQGESGNVEMVPAGSNVVIEFNAIPNPELLEKYMRVVYANRRKDRLRWQGFSGIMFASGLVFGKMLGHHKAEKEYQSERIVDPRYQK